ncbi:RidA family protein [Salinibaculum salinum]|uniref:RidA family protein n=1 Tax=Salinibaculum salinum TaxID=3131996 RepID=UPI0030EE3EB5
MTRTIETDDAPAAVATYSQGATDGNLVFTAGQVPLTPDGELLETESMAVQTKQALSNIEAILAAEGAAPSDILKTTVYLVDMDEYEQMEEAYADWFEGLSPARTVVEVGRLAVDAAIEIEAIAVSG